LKQSGSIEKMRKFNAKFFAEMLAVATLSWPIRHLWRLATGLPALDLEVSC
jgi:hypothetical protein